MRGRPACGTMLPMPESAPESGAAFPPDPPDAPDAADAPAPDGPLPPPRPVRAGVAVAAPSPIVVLALPPAPRRVGWILGVAAVVMGAIALGLGWSAQSGMAGAGPGPGWIEPVRVLAFILTVVLVAAVLNRVGQFSKGTKEATRLSLEAGSAPRLLAMPDAQWRMAALAALSTEGHFDSTRVLTARWRRLFDPLPGPNPAFVADRFTQHLAQAITTMVEPQASGVVVRGWPAWLSAPCVLGILMLLPVPTLLLDGVARSASATGGATNPLDAPGVQIALGLLVAGVAFIIISTPVLRRALRLAGAPLVAAPGEIRTRRGGRWTPADSVLLVQPDSSGGQAGQVRLIGPAGEARLRIRNLRSLESRVLLGAWSWPWISGAVAAGALSDAARPAGTEDAHQPALTTMESALAGHAPGAFIESELPAAATAGEDRPEDAEVIAVVPLAIASRRERFPLVRIAVAVAVPTMLVTYWFLVPGALGGMVCVGPIILTVMVAVFASIFSKRREIDRGVIRAAHATLADPSSTELARIVAAVTARLGVRPRRDAMQREWVGMVAGLSPRPLAIVAPSVWPALRRLGRTATFLEPHQVYAGDQGGTTLAAAAPYAFMALLMGMMGSKWLAAILGVTAGFLLLNVPAVRYRLPLLRLGSASTVLGPGWVRDRKERTWTVKDSVLFVAPGAWRSGITIRLVGPAGMVTWDYASADSPEFMALWRLWTHRDPRPELAGPV